MLRIFPMILICATTSIFFAATASPASSPYGNCNAGPRRPLAFRVIPVRVSPSGGEKKSFRSRSHSDIVSRSNFSGGAQRSSVPSGCPGGARRGAALFSAAGSDDVNGSSSFSSPPFRSRWARRNASSSSSRTGSSEAAAVDERRLADIFVGGNGAMVKLMLAGRWSQRIGADAETGSDDLSVSRARKRRTIPLITNPYLFDDAPPIMAQTSLTGGVFSNYNPVRSLIEYDALTVDGKARILLRLESFRGTLPRPRAVKSGVLDDILLPLIDETVRRQYLVRSAEQRGDFDEANALRNEMSNRQEMIEAARIARDDGRDNDAERLESEAKLYGALRADVTQDEGAYSRFLDREEWYERVPRWNVGRDNRFVLAAFGRRDAIARAVSFSALSFLVRLAPAGAYTPDADELRESLYLISRVQEATVLQERFVSRATRQEDLRSKMKLTLRLVEKNYRLLDQITFTSNYVRPQDVVDSTAAGYAAAEALQNAIEYVNTSLKQGPFEEGQQEYLSSNLRECRESLFDFLAFVPPKKLEEARKRVEEENVLNRDEFEGDADAGVYNPVVLPWKNR